MNDKGSIGPAAEAPTLFPQPPAARKRPRKGTRENGFGNLHAFNTIKDKLPYCQSTRLGDYFIQVLADEMGKRKWDSSLAKARVLVETFYPPEPPPWAKPLPSPEPPGDSGGV